MEGNIFNPAEHAQNRLRQAMKDYEANLAQEDQTDSALVLRDGCREEQDQTAVVLPEKPPPR